MRCAIGLQLVLTAALLPAAAAHAQTVYRCTTPAGAVIFQDAPCPSAAPGAQITVRAPNLMQADRAGIARVQRAEQVRQAVESGELLPGMTAAEVLKVWGAPSAINTDVVGGVRHEQLVYRHGDGQRYVYLQDGVVSAYQIRPRPPRR